MTLSGGDPLNEHNLDDILQLVKDVKTKFPKKDIWIYTGYTYEELQQDSKDMEKRREILSYCDVLVDGKFEEDKKNLSIMLRGSSNQRVIDVNKSLNNHDIVMYEVG